MKEKIILDCDPGMDDSMALIMAAKSERLELLAVTAVNGNYPVAVTTVNACKTLELLCRSDIPVYKGMSLPMVRRSPKDPFTHGSDGQAEANLPIPVKREEGIHAVNAIIDAVKRNPNEVTIVATGPLSNVAMAMRMEPQIIPMIKEIVAISGAFGLNESSFLNATGDTPQSEWNVFVDPEAAKIVYESGVKLTLIGLDVATHFDVDLTSEDIKELEASPKKEAQFWSNAIRFVKKRGFGAYCTCIDCMAVAYVIDRSLVRTEKAHVGVEVKDGLTLGMTVRDGRHHFVWEELPLVNIAIGADHKGFLKLLKSLVLK